MERDEARANTRRRNQSLAFKIGAVALVTLGLSYAFVPLYQLFCQATGYGGTTQTGKKSVDVLREQSADGDASALPPSKEMTIYFNADISQNLAWTFVPSQRSLRCKPGEPVLAFYR